MIAEGEGIVTFTERLHAEKAIQQMHGQRILSSIVHCDWVFDVGDDTNSIATSHSRRSSTDSDTGTTFGIEI